MARRKPGASLGGAGNVLVRTDFDREAPGYFCNGVQQTTRGGVVFHGVGGVMSDKGGVWTLPFTACGCATYWCCA